MHLRGWRVNPGHDKALLYFGGNAEDLRQARAQLAPLLPDYSVSLLAYTADAVVCDFSRDGL